MADGNATLIGPRVLGVIAHPDDETIFAATGYRIVRELGGALDLALVTNGEGGFRYSAMAEPLYGVALSDERIGRSHLPEIRKRELRSAGEILGVSAYHWIDQIDTSPTLDAAPFFAGVWDTTAVRERLRAIVAAGSYDFVLTMLPIASAHAHHQVSGILAIEAVLALPIEQRPVVLGALEYDRSTRPSFFGASSWSATRVSARAPVFEVDRRKTFGPNGALDYHIVVNWVIAAHKTQGLAQTRMGLHDIEGYWLYAENNAAGEERAAALFARLA